MDIKLTQFTSLHYEKYKNFSEKSWGKQAYQKSQNYIQWLCGGNSLSIKKPEDLMLVENKFGEIVGCIHKLRQPWLIDGDIVDIPAAYNTYIDEAYRKGAGLVLIFSAFENELAIIAPGCGKTAADICHKLPRYYQIKISWYRHILRPIPSVFKYIKSKIFSEKDELNRIVFLPRFQNDVMYSMSPDETVLKNMLFSYHAYTKHFDIKQHYEQGLLKWRFFSANGPRHVLIYTYNKQGMLDFLIVSLGVHQGLYVGRIIESAFSPESFQMLYAATLKFFKANKTDALAIFSGDPALNTALQKIGYKPCKKTPETFVYFSKKEHSLKSLRVSAAAGDFGFESIPLDATI